MKVLFLKDVRKVGRKSEVKEINDGYARNYLIPQNLARPVTEKEVKELAYKAEQAKERSVVQSDLLRKNLEQLAGKTITLKERANASGNLFSSVHGKEILAALHAQAHIELPEGAITMEKPIKEVGEYRIPVSLGKEAGEFTVIVEAL